MTERAEPPRYSVLLRRQQPFDFQEVSRLLREEAGIPLADAARIAKRRPGILSPSLPRPDARALVLGLRDIGIEAFMAREDLLFSPPVSTHIEALELLEDGFRAAISNAAGIQVTIPYRSVSMLCAAHIASPSPGGDLKIAIKRGTSHRSSRSKQVLAFAPQVTRSAFDVLDIYMGFLDAPPPGIRPPGMLGHIRSTAFDFGCLGKQRAKRNDENLRILTRFFADRAQKAALSPGAEELVREGKFDCGVFQTLHAFQDDCLWRLDLLLLDKRKREKEAGGEN